MKTILKSNGYLTDAGSNVYVWKEYPTDSSYLPCIIIRDKTDEVETGVHEHTHALNVEIGFKTDGSTAATEMRKISDDVYKAIGVDTSMGGYCESIDVSTIDFEVEHDEKINADGTINIVLHYSTPAFDGSKIYNIGRQ